MTASAATPAVPDNSQAWIALAGIACLLSAAGALLYFMRNRSAMVHNPIATPSPQAAEIVETAKDGVFVIQETGEILFTNPAAEKLFGYPFSEVRNKSIATLIPPPARGRHRANYIQNSEGRELFGRRRSGERFPLDLAVSEMAGPSPRRFSIVVRDRSERNRAELELQSRQEFAAALVEFLPSLLVVVDVEGRIVRFNRACEELTQFSEGEIRGQFLWQAVAAPSQMIEAERQIRAVLDGDFPSRNETIWCLRDNSLRTIVWHYSALRDDTGRVTHILGSGQDVTVRIQAEERMRETESLETAGRLAGGIAHDFNNLLTAITGYSGLVLDALEHGHPVRDDVEEIKKASGRAASMTRQLLAFSGNQPRHLRTVDVNQCVRNVERLLRVFANGGIHLDLSLEPGLPPVNADPGQIEECIMQLAANAKEAMRHGGTLQIQTGVRTLNRTRLDARPPIGPGEFVTISVVDTGDGIEAEALQHLFEPFYTTKNNPASKGMGLSIVYGIVRQSAGSIIVHSAPKYGSTFRLFLPLAPDQVSKIPEAGPDLESLAGEEVVLLAIDSDAARGQLREALETSGYTVIEARSGLQAMELAHKLPHIIHLAIVDVVLPRIEGLALVEAIRADRPAIRVLFASALSESEISRHGVPPALVFRMDRKIDPRNLLIRVRETLTTETPR